MHWEDLIPIVITIFIILSALFKVIFCAPQFRKYFGVVVKALTPIVAAEIAEQLANGVLKPLAERGLLPANTTALPISDLF